MRVDVAHGLTIALTRSSGLDARYMISQLKPKNTEILSLTTIATPHRGGVEECASEGCSDCLQDHASRTLSSIKSGVGRIAPHGNHGTDDAAALNIPKIYKALEFFGLETGAFSQLTRSYMSDKFNPATPDDPNVQ